MLFISLFSYVIFICWFHRSARTKKSNLDPREAVLIKELLLLTLNRVDGYVWFPALSQRLGYELCSCVRRLETLQLTLAAVEIHVHFTPAIRDDDDTITDN